MNVAIGTGLALVAIVGACLFVLWYGSAVLIDQLEDRIEVLERNWAEQFGPPVEDEPAAEDAEAKPEEMPTDEIPVAPETVPDGMPLAVHTALMEQRPSPVPRGKSAEWVEAELARFNFAGRNR